MVDLTLLLGDINALFIRVGALFYALCCVRQLFNRAKKESAFFLSLVEQPTNPSRRCYVRLNEYRNHLRTRYPGLDYDDGENTTGFRINFGRVWRKAAQKAGRWFGRVEDGAAIN